MQMRHDIWEYRSTACRRPSRRPPGDAADGPGGNACGLAGRPRGSPTSPIRAATPISGSRLGTAAARRARSHARTILKSASAYLRGRRTASGLRICLQGNGGLKFGVWLVRPDGSDNHQILAQGLSPAWSENSEWLSYVEESNTPIKRVDVRSKATEQVRTEPARNIIGVHGRNCLLRCRSRAGRRTQGVRTARRADRERRGAAHHDAAHFTDAGLAGHQSRHCPRTVCSSRCRSPTDLPPISGRFRLSAPNPGSE